MKKASQLVRQILPLRNWKFKQSARFFDNKIYPTIIYDSEMCRMKVYFNVHSRRGHHNLIIYYGRLEVPDKAELLLRKGQKNYHLLWHGIRLPIFFLDGLSPREAVIEKRPRFIREFDQSEVVKGIEYQPEKNLALEVAIWEAYGQRFFKLFDNHNTRLWEQYSAFIRDYLEARLTPSR